MNLNKIQFGHHDTAKNLPGRGNTPTQEDIFLKQFENHWLPTFSSGNFGHEFEMDGFGRADLIVLSQHILIAVEAKLKNWRKGMVQAARYRYFAHQSILVMPSTGIQPALPYLETFSELNVGLWEFQLESAMIIQHVTSVTKKPFNEKQHIKAINKFIRKSQ